MVGKTESLAGHLRARARWRLDRVQRDDGGWNARCALALLDAACYVRALPDDDPLIVAVGEAGCFGPDGSGDFRPGAEAARLIDSWQPGEPRDLLAAILAPGRDALPGSAPTAT